MIPLPLGLGSLAWTGLGFVLGYLLSQLLQRHRQSQLEQVNSSLSATQGMLQGLFEQSQQDKAQLQQQHEQLIGQLAQAQTQLAQWQQQAQWSQSMLDTGKQMLEQSFSSLAGKALQHNHEQFLHLAEQRLALYQQQTQAAVTAKEQAIQHLVAPLQLALTQLQQKNEQLELQHTARQSQLQQQLQTLFDNMQQLGQTTHQLATTLKGSHSKGKWGELALRNIAELAGMSNHCDFVEQVELSHGKRPDMLVRLPGQRHIAIDAKAPLDAYLRWQQASHEQEQKEAAKKHVEVLRGHIKALVARDYGKTQEAAMVVLFVPFESMLGLAFEQSPDLYNEALRQGILLATPTTLIALLRTLGIYWEQHALASNSQQIAECANELYNRAVKFQEYLHTVGKGLQTAVDGYNSAIGSFGSRLIPMGRKLESLQATERSKQLLEDVHPIETPLRPLI